MELLTICKGTLRDKDPPTLAAFPLWSKMQFLNADEALRKRRLFLKRQSLRLLADSHQQRHDIPSEEVWTEEKRQGEERLSEIEEEQNMA